MKLQFSEEGSQPRLIIGVDEVIIKDNFAFIVHSDNVVKCKIDLGKCSTLFLQADDDLNIAIKSCRADGRISIDDSKKLSVIVSDGKTVVNNVDCSRCFAVHLDEF